MTAVRQHRVNYLGPKLEVVAGRYRLTDRVPTFDVWTSRTDPADIAQIVVAAELDLAEGDPLAIAWGYKGYEPSPIFNGYVDDVRPLRNQRRTLILGTDPMKRLFERRVTKTFTLERPATILRNLLEPLGVDTSGIAEVDVILDRLPLHNDHIVHAIRTINRRLRLDHQFWFGTSGTFHWAPLVVPPDVAWRFVEGENVIRYEPFAGGARLTTIGIPAQHGQRVEVQTASQNLNAYWIERANHYQPEGRGFRTTLDLRDDPS